MLTLQQPSGYLHKIIDTLDTDANTLAVDLAGEYELALRQVKQQIERLERQA
jgi:hypothetical protein